MLPYGTDAPIYHLPIGTILMIVTNVVCFFAHGELDVDSPWVLQFGVFPRLLQWLSSMFSHFGLVHLIGNMYFLFVYGFIVEGKLGWRRFITLYISIGLVAAAVTQLLMWPFSGDVAAGASCAIMGLMAVCLIWAPKNELSVIFILPTFFFLYPRAFLFDITIFAYSLFYVGYELFWFAILHGIFDFRMSTPALHLIGFGCGLGAGVVYVKRDWVDCENWDLFAVLSGTYGRYGDELTTVGAHADTKLLFGKEVDVSGKALPEDAPEMRGNLPPALDGVVRLIDSGQLMEASEALFSLQMGNEDNQLNESYLRNLARGLHDGDAFDEAEYFLEEYDQRFEKRADWCRVRLAHLKLHQRGQPRAAMSFLKRVRLSQLTPEQQEKAKRTVARAKKMIKAGVEDRVDDFG